MASKIQSKSTKNLYVCSRASFGDILARFGTNLVPFGGNCGHGKHAAALMALLAIKSQLCKKVDLLCCSCLLDGNGEHILLQRNYEDGRLVNSCRSLVEPLQPISIFRSMDFVCDLCALHSWKPLLFEQSFGKCQCALRGSLLYGLQHDARHMLWASLFEARYRAWNGDIMGHWGCLAGSRNFEHLAEGSVDENDAVCKHQTEPRNKVKK